MNGNARDARCGHDDLARFTGSDAFAGFVDKFEDDVLGGDVHPALGTFVGDESGVASAIPVGHPAAEDLFDGRPLVVVKTFGRHEGDFDSDVVEPNVPRLRVPCDVRERGWVAEQHSRTPLTNLPDVIVESRWRHVERRQQCRTKHKIAQSAGPGPVRRARSAIPTRRSPDPRYPRRTSASRATWPRHRVRRARASR